MEKRQEMLIYDLQDTIYAPPGGKVMNNCYYFETDD
jgi:hypothetical protein